MAARPNAWRKPSGQSEFGAAGYLRSQRERMNWSQAELAARVGVSDATISRIETGQRPITSLETLMRLAQELAIGFDDLLSLVIGDYRMKAGGWRDRT
ncbi:helix-turn-helix domain-containing protein [Amycolatopsis sp. cmx-11-12]|uniref:helix-turn-helix domain-containing protein n=1 Tax=Amycolatopsis sp. cmx-11-12 TaxID=2785795 RepID=UPI0039171ADF